MKKSEFKKLIKPIVQECIKESLLENGIISGVIAEVVKGMTPATVSAPPPTPDPELNRLQRNAFSDKQNETLREHRSKLMSAIGENTFNGVNLFEGTTPAPGQTTPQQQASPLSGQAPGDAGIDIGNIIGAVGRNWNAHMKETLKERK
jgi:hypothetical protein